METINIVLSGLGGQGILFMTRVMAHAALAKGLDILGAETHGMAQRGGSVTSHLRLGEARSSLIRSGTAHFVLSLDENEGYRNLPFLSKGGRLYVNAHPDRFPRGEVKAFLDKREIVYRSVAATAIAQQLGARRSSNLVLLGYFSAFEERPIGYEDIRASVEKVTPEGFKNLNLKVFDVGHKRGLQASRV